MSQPIAFAPARESYYSTPNALHAASQPAGWNLESITEKEPLELSETPSPISVSCEPIKEPSVSYTPRRKLQRARRRNAARDSCCKTFFDLYEFEKDAILGQGAYAVVRIARHKENGTRWAIKVIDREDKSHTREKCLNELVLLNKCTGHKNVLQMREFFEDSKHFYLVFEYVQGGNLQSQLDLRGGSFEEIEVNHLVYDLAKGLQFLHETARIAHRDLKPANILCENKDWASPCKIADFDLARAEKENKDSSFKGQRSSEIDSGIGLSPPLVGGSLPYSWNGQGMYQEDARKNMIMSSAVGSPEYMAPEIAALFMVENEYDMQMKYTQACDIWSLGIIAYVCLVGEPPFRASVCCNPYCQWEDGGSCRDCQDSLFWNIYHGQLRFSGPKWDKITDEAKHFIYRCLDRNADTRLTASEMLEHAFLKRLTPPLCPVANKSHVDVSKSSANGNTKPATDGYISKEMLDQEKVRKLFANCTVSDAQRDELERSGALASTSHSVIPGEYHMDSDSGSQEYGEEYFIHHASASKEHAGFYLTQLE